MGEEQGKGETDDENREERSVGAQKRAAVAGVLGAIAFFPVLAVLMDTPIANARDSGTGYGGASTDHLTPSTIPYKPTGPLLR